LGGCLLLRLGTLLVAPAHAAEQSAGPGPDCSSLAGITRDGTTHGTDRSAPGSTSEQTALRRRGRRTDPS
jgi:hypothetical protein